MHHIFFSHGFSSFSASRRRIVSDEIEPCFVRRTISPASKSSVQRARPAGGAEHAVAMSKRLLLLRELAVGARTRQLAQRGLEPFLDEAALRPEDGRRPRPRCSSRSSRRVSRLGCEQDLRALQPSKRTLSRLNEAPKLLAFLDRQRDAVPYVHDGLPRTIDHAAAPMSIDSSAPRFTETQGQYLAFIYYYCLVNRRPPAEADIQAFFRVTPPSVHRMVIELEQRGLIQPHPSPGAKHCGLRIRAKKSLGYARNRSKPLCRGTRRAVGRRRSHPVARTKLLAHRGAPLPQIPRRRDLAGVPFSLRWGGSRKVVAPRDRAFLPNTSRRGQRRRGRPGGRRGGRRSRRARGGYFPKGDCPHCLRRRSRTPTRDGPRRRGLFEGQEWVFRGDELVEPGHTGCR